MLVDNDDNEEEEEDEMKENENKLKRMTDKVGKNNTKQVKIVKSKGMKVKREDRRLWV